MRPNKKLIIIFLIIIIGVVASVTFYFIRAKSNPEEYNATLADLELAKNPILLYLNIPEGNNSAEFPASFSVLSSDGKINLNLDEPAIAKYEFVSPQKMFVSGRIYQNEELGDKEKAYWITANEIKEIASDSKTKMEFPSLSPAQKFIRFNTDADICIADFSTAEIGECQSLIAKLNNNLDFTNDYSIDGDWLKNEEVYVLRVMSRTESHNEPAEEKNMPPRLVQNETARYFYYPETGKLKAVSLNDEMKLKTRDLFLTPAEQTLVDIFDKNGKYELVNNGADSSVGILEKETDKFAKLTNAPFTNLANELMPMFDLKYYVK